MLVTTKVRLALDLLLGSPQICLFIGDSHARHFCGHNKGEIGELIRVRQAEYLLWIGSRLMHTVATKGLMKESAMVLKSLAWMRRKLTLLWFLGEIDIRVYGVKYYLHGVPAIERMIRQYISYIATTFPEHIHVLAVPTAPSSFGSGDTEFPTNGSLEQRMQVFEDVKSVMGRIAGEQGISVFDQNQLNKSQCLTEEVSIDGCHYKPQYNASMITMWREVEWPKVLWGK